MAAPRVVLTRRVPVPTNFALIVTHAINVILAPISTAASANSPAHLSLKSIASAPLVRLRWTRVGRICGVCGAASG